MKIARSSHIKGIDVSTNSASVPSDCPLKISEAGLPEVLQNETNHEWDLHWARQKQSIFGSLCSIYRRQVRSRSVAFYFERYFPRSGTFAECGSGSSETSSRVRLYDRRLIAVDYSREALTRAARMPQISECVLADVRELPFAPNSLDGIWNLGVMEHFVHDEQIMILKSFREILKPGGKVLLWWPPKWALDHAILSPFGWDFPAEPGRVNRAEVRAIMDAAGFHDITVKFLFSDMFTELLVVGSA